MTRIAWTAKRHRSHVNGRRGERAAFYRFLVTTRLDEIARRVMTKGRVGA
jgi:hypothetical protein